MPDKGNRYAHDVRAEAVGDFVGSHGGLELGEGGEAGAVVDAVGAGSRGLCCGGLGDPRSS